MVKELLLKDDRDKLQIVQEKMNNSSRITTSKVVPPLRDVVDQPELSLGSYLSCQADCTNSSSFKIEANSRRKRKLEIWEEHSLQTSLDFHLNDPLPLDWEQCLDLQSGSMYYINRKTLKKSWERPKEQKLDLELNISTHPTSESCKKSSSQTLEETKKESTSSSGREAASSSMVAIVCFNCHMLVMLCRSSPSCPNCKYMHSLLLSPTPSPQKVEVVKPLETLSLLH